MKEDEYIDSSASSEEIDELKRSLQLEIRNCVKQKGESGTLAPMRLSVTKPDVAAEILYLWSLGATQTKLVKKYGYSRTTIQNVLMDYSDRVDGWRKLAGEISARSWLSISSLEEDVVDQLRDKLSSGEIDVTFTDLKHLSYAKLSSGRDAMAARGHASTITQHNVVYSAADYEDTLKRAQERLNELKRCDEGEIIDVGQ